jgi:hypothetical protein
MKPRRDASCPARTAAAAVASTIARPAVFFADRQLHHVPMQLKPVPVDAGPQCELALQRGAAVQQPSRALKHDQRISKEGRTKAFVEQISCDQRAVEIEHQRHRHRKAEQRNGPIAGTLALRI